MKYVCVCVYTMVHVRKLIRRCCAICREFASHSPTEFIYWEFLECAVSFSWSQSRGHGCAVFFLIFFFVWLALQTWMPLYTHTTHTNITHIMHALTMEMEIRSFWRVFRTSVIVFDFRTNYGKSVLVGSSAHMILVIWVCTTVMTPSFTTGGQWSPFAWYTQISQIFQISQFAKI